MIKVDKVGKKVKVSVIIPITLTSTLYNISKQPKRSKKTKSPIKQKKIVDPPNGQLTFDVNVG